MLSTGFGFNGVVVPRNRSVILSPEVYFSRGTRGERTDVVTVYDPRKLEPVAEIGIPPKRASHMPMTRERRAHGRRPVPGDLQLHARADGQRRRRQDPEVRRRDRPRRMRPRVSDRAAQLLLAVRRRHGAHRAARRRGQGGVQGAHGQALRSDQGSRHGERPRDAATPGTSSASRATSCPCRPSKAASRPARAGRSWTRPTARRRGARVACNICPFTPPAGASTA